MNISYQKILKQAWQFSIKNKILWIFGIFASFISYEAVYELLLSQIKLLKSSAALHTQVLSLYDYQANFIYQKTKFFSLIPQDLASFASFIIILAIIAFFIWLVYMSQIVIIRSTAQGINNKKTDFNGNLAASSEKFWPVLGINIITKLVLYTGFIGLSLPLLYAILTNNVSGVVIFNLLFFVIFSIFAIFVSFITAYATNFIILKDLHLLDAIKQAYNLFIKNKIISLEIALILYLLRLLSIIIIVSLCFLFLVPIGILAILLYGKGSALAYMLTCIIGFIVFLIIILAVNSLYTIFYLSSWTITFLNIAEESLIGKIAHFIKNLTGKFEDQTTKYIANIDTDEVKDKLAKFANKTTKEAQILSKKLEEKYIQYQPVVKKQAKKAAKRAKKEYKKYKPVVEKEAKKMYKKAKAEYIKQEPKIKKTAKKAATKLKKEYKKVKPLVVKEVKKAVKKTQPKKTTKRKTKSKKS